MMSNIRSGSVDWESLKRELGMAARGMAAGKRRNYVEVIDKMRPKPSNRDIGHFFGVSASTITKDRVELGKLRGGYREEMRRQAEVVAELVSVADSKVKSEMARLGKLRPAGIDGEVLVEMAWDGWFESREAAEVARRNGDLREQNAALNAAYRWSELFEKRYDKLMGVGQAIAADEEDEELDFDTDYGE